MPDEDRSAAIFAALADLFAPYRPLLVAKADQPGNLSFEAPPSPNYPKGLFFGGVKTGKRYVSFHLMPVYVHPDLLDGISPALRKRMQGKSCFNVTRMDDDLLVELGRLTAAGFAQFQADGTIPPGAP